MAIASITPYRNNSDKKVRAKALFYLALSHYKLKKYDRALDYLVNPLVVQAYGKRARFWYQRTLEKIR